MTRRPRPVSFAAVAGELVWLAVTAAGPGLQAQRPSQKELLDSATAYSLAFLERFSNVVAEETYRQRTSRPKATSRSSSRSRSTPPSRTPSGS